MSVESNTVKASISLWRRIRAWTIVCVLYGLALAFAVAGLIVLRHAFTHDLDIAERLYRLFTAATLLSFPVLIIWLHIRTKRATGRWLGSTQEGRRRVAMCVMRPQGRIHSNERSILFYVLHWANIALRAPESPLWKRLLGALTLIAYAAVLLAIIAISILFIGAGIGTFASLGWMMILFGLVLLVIPGQFIAALVHRYRTLGDLRSSPDDLAGITAARTVWFARQRQQPLRAKLVSTALCVAVLTVLWLRVTVFHSRHPHESWVTPFFWTLFAAYLLWNQFHRPKNPPAKYSSPYPPR